MRLLNTESLEFREFFDTDIPKYAILSHRWEPSNSVLREIEFEEFSALTIEQRRCLHKISMFCNYAHAHRYDWAWVDTCCIDKRSSAELTEAINSMFRWYKQAARCYVYFNDVEWDQADPEASRSQFLSSKWFTRGWTLQELLAPRYLYCYDKHWNQFGDRNSLAHDITEATGISIAHLSNQQTASVAMIMSWAARRETSRIEDMAYSLLGLFDINMPMLYGEGMNSFIRLQRKIIKKTDDESIFAWSHPMVFKPHGMLAPSPSAFAGYGDVVVASGVTIKRRPYSITNKGLELYVNLPSTKESGARYQDQSLIKDGFHPDQTLILGLNCEKRSVTQGEARYLAIKLEKIEGQWRRVNCDQPCLLRHSIETSFKDGPRTWPTESMTENTAIYIG